MRPKSTDAVHNVVKCGKIILAKADSTNPKLPRKRVTELSTILRVSHLSEDHIQKTMSKKCESNSAVTNDASDEIVTVVNSNDVKNKINCRLCDRDITGKECQLLYDPEENMETRLGRKINIIINSTETAYNLSQYCCSVCTSKIEICFSLLVEIQASDEVIKQTYGHMSSGGVSVDTSTQLFICGECKSTITGIKSFIRHYENHILKKTVINSKRDVKVSQTVPSSGHEADEMDSVNGLTDALKSNEKYREMTVEEELSEDNAEKTSQVSDESRTRSRTRKRQDGAGLSSDGDELVKTASENEERVSEQDTEEGAEDLQEKGDDDAVMSGSEGSVSSDASYKKLVNIVRKELEKSDSEDDQNLKAVEANEDGGYDCSTCGLTFEYKFLLSHHLMQDHKWTGLGEDESMSEVLKVDLDENGCVECPRCQEVVAAGDIQSHITECSGEFASDDVLCHACGKICTAKQWLSHKKTHMSQAGMWSCHLCGKRFKAKRILRSHLGEHDESKKKVCEICGKKLLSLSFFRHMTKHKEKRHVCQYCGKGFTYNYALRTHLKVHSGATDAMEAKPGKKRDKVLCWLCKKEFDSSSSLHKHLKSEHNVESVEQDSRFACSECDKKFADMFGLKAHLKLIHEMKDEEISRFKSLPVYRFIECNVCNQWFNSENKVRIHMKQDHGLKPFEMEILKKECEKCGKRFASKQNLIHHINGAHLNIKPMQCDVCNERFAKHSSLIYHKLRHSGEKPFQCEFCRKTYRQRNDVIRHLARHVRDQEITLEEASAINNSPSPLVLKRRIFLKDSSISYQTRTSRNRRQKAEVVEVDPEPAVEAKIEYDEGSLMYVEEVMADEIQQPESPAEVKYMTVKPVYNEERNTIILSSPELFKNAVENVSYRYMTQHGGDAPAVIVKKEVEM